MTEYVKEGDVPMKANTQTKEIIINFLLHLIEFEVRKKELMLEIKDLKNDYKEEGIPVPLVTSLFNIVKKNKKRTPSERFEADAIMTWLEESKEIDDALLKLVE